ncbi:MAG TPA: ABC transporter ATP-binding protein [Phycisphaerae bacterium]|nr:ABC transporter ATP-binding protein [Phycisphaerae bacterium]HNU44080.1 ABC transporter ATP-binding protein [Phycisphaerae bacterium]
MLKAVQLRKDYHMGHTVVHALDGVDLHIPAGGFVAITGASGSGKSTLMHILGCLDRPTAGLLEFNGQRISGIGEKQLARLRNQHIGFVFQTFNLISRTSALDNVLLPLVYTRRAYRRKHALEALERVGLAARAKHTPSEMSGGECQRVAIARAIVNRPRLILADEPTGNLDTRTGDQIMAIFDELHAEGITIVLVTHEVDIAVRAQRIIRMQDGRIVEDHPVAPEQRQVVLASRGQGLPASGAIQPMQEPPAERGAVAGVLGVSATGE